MTQYYVQREGVRHYTVRATNGQNSEILATFTSKRAAMADVAKLNRLE